MKRIAYIMMAAFAMNLCIVSCNDDDDDEVKGEEQKESKQQEEQYFIDSIKYAYPNYLDSLMSDGGRISGIKLICLDKGGNLDAESYYYWNYQEKGTTPIFKKYSDIKLHVPVQRIYAIYSAPELDRGTQSAVFKKFYEYGKKRMEYVWKEQNEFMDSMRIALSGYGGLPTSIFFTASIDGEVTLTCDKPLFGQQPGENLASHMKVKNYCACCLPAGHENPWMYYNFEDCQLIWEGIRMSNFFKLDSWLVLKYIIEFIDIPEEQYDELQFKLTMPLQRDHVQQSILNKINGMSDTLKVTHDVYTATCTVKFNWE